MAVWILQAVSLLLISSSFRLVDGQGNSRPPNILFLLADDLGWYDVGYHNPKIQTPNINKLVKGGVLLNNYYVQQVCTPTRGSVMTGRYPIHTGIWMSTVESEAWANSTPKALAKVSVLSERPKTKHKKIRLTTKAWSVTERFYALTLCYLTSCACKYSSWWNKQNRSYYAGQTQSLSVKQGSSVV